MKKVLLLAAALLISANLMADEVVFKLGLDKNKTINATGTYNVELNPEETITLQAEYFGELDDNLYLGIGANIGSTIKIENGGDFATLIPIYVTGKYKFTGRDVRPYVGVKFGYTLSSIEDLDYDEEETGGLYAGLNAGLEFSSGLMVEASIEEARYGFESKLAGEKTDLKSPKVGINFGYRVDLY